jgi:hypothetical protein
MTVITAMKPTTLISKVKNEYQTKMWVSEKLLISGCGKFNRLDATISAVRDSSPDTVTSCDVNFCYPDRVTQIEFVPGAKKVSANCA